MAAYLRVSVRTLQRWEHDGYGPPRLPASRVARYSWAAVREWARTAHRPAATSGEG